MLHDVKVGSKIFTLGHLTVAKVLKDSDKTSSQKFLQKKNLRFWSRRYQKVDRERPVAF